MKILYASWAVMLLTIVQWARGARARTGRFDELASEERCEALNLAWEPDAGPDATRAFLRGGMALLSLGVLVELLRQLEAKLPVWVVDAQASMGTSLEVGVSLLGVYVAGLALFRILETQGSEHRRELARSFLAGRLATWRKRVVGVFRELNRRDGELPAEGVRILLSRAEPAPGGVPYKTLRLVEVVIAEDLYLVVGPVFDARRESRFLSVDLDYSPRVDAESAERHRIPYGEVLSIEYAEPSSGATLGVLQVTKVGGEVLSLPVDPDGAGAVVDCVQARRNAYVAVGAAAERRPDDGVVLLAEAKGRPDAERVECQQCAEHIKAKARVCRFCGHRQGPSLLDAA